MISAISIPSEASLPPYRNVDRRRSLRFPISIAVKYLIDGKEGTGNSVNISSGGIMFTTDKPLPSRGVITLSLAWPHLLDGRVPLQVVIDGNILRSSPQLAVVRIMRHEFRVKGQP
jgi:hypothetical protein